MRLSDLVARQGINSFTADDFNFVTSKVSDQPNRLILVGGQAIEVWGVLLDVPSPLGDRQPLTEDADWLGGKLDARWLCDRLGAPADVQLQFAGDHDSTPSAAIAYLRRGGRILMMDFLRMIVGPSVDAIRRLAVQVEVDGGHVICVMHPLLCLESRFSNLEIIPAKRSGNGPMQAEWALSIATAYLRRMVSEGMDPDQVVKACRQIERLAMSSAGKYCYINYQLNPMACIPGDVIDYVGGMFQSRDWPLRLERSVNRMARWRDIADRAIQQVPGSR